MTNKRLQDIFRVVALANLIGLLWVHAAAAATINVPGGQPTIQAGVDAAGPGDIVAVAPGVYNEAVVITAKSNLTLRGSGYTTTTIQAPGGGPAIRVDSSSVVTITGFRLSSDMISGDNYQFAAIRVFESSNVRVYKNLITRHNSNGIVLFGSSLEAFNNVITQVGDDGIRLDDQESTDPNSALIYNNTIAGNRGGSGVGIWLRRNIDTATAFNNILYNNDYNIGLQNASIFNHDYNLISTTAANFYGYVGRNSHEPDCDPLLVDVSSLDFRIPSGSCADNAGTASFNTRPAASDDIDGNARPSGGGFDLGADEIAITLVCEPQSQGYWHRQCLGVGAIAPGRGKGPGPHPDYNSEEFNELVLIVDEMLAFSSQNTCEALDADPPRDHCERALKQYAAMLLNVAAGYLSPQCPVIVANAPGTVGELMPYVRDLIQRGDCKRAASICASVNEGTGLGVAGDIAFASVSVTGAERLFGRASGILPSGTAGNFQSPPATAGDGGSLAGQRAPAARGDGPNVSEGHVIPAQASLAIHPNPGLTQEVDFGLPRQANVDLEVYDLSGRRIAVIASGTFEAGTHTIIWNGRTLDNTTAGAGMYFYRLRVGGEVFTARAIRVQ